MNNSLVSNEGEIWGDILENNITAGLPNLPSSHSDKRFQFGIIIGVRKPITRDKFIRKTNMIGRHSRDSIPYSMSFNTMMKQMLSRLIIQATKDAYIFGANINRMKEATNRNFAFKN